MEKLSFNHQTALSQIFNKYRFFTMFFTVTVLLSALLASVFIYGWINGSTCHYTLTLKTDERDTAATCYRGKAVVIHTKVNDRAHLIDDSLAHLMSLAMHFHEKILPVYPSLI